MIDHTGLERYRLSFCLCCSSNRDYLSLSSALLGWDTAVWTGSSAQGSTAAHRPSAPVPSQKETAQVCPTPTPTLHRHFPPATPQGHHPAPNSTSNPTELITTLSLATQDRSSRAYLSWVILLCALYKMGYSTIMMECANLKFALHCSSLRFRPSLLIFISFIAGWIYVFSFNNNQICTSCLVAFSSVQAQFMIIKLYINFSRLFYAT